MISPAQKEHALEVLESLRRRCGVGLDHEAMDFFYEFAEGVDPFLTREIYHSVVHFILELIQNADDAKFPETPGHVPTLTFTLDLETNRLVVRCNQIGFTDGDVRALCHVGHSSKTTRNSGTKDSIGEKGIGFKSVFAVADKVAIYSNGYNFVLDRTKRLGTVCPIVESEFLSEEYKDDDDTIVELFLALEDAEKTQLRQRFLDLEPEMLLFLRRLRRLEIKFRNQQMLAHECDKVGRVASIATDKLSGRSFEKYHLSDMVWTNLPANEKRESRETRTTLAFPFSDSGPVIEHQKLYAFLPLQNTCFFFLAHADFLTQANREEVLENQWNTTLGSAIARHFVAALSTLKSKTEIGARLIEYIPDPRHFNYNPFHKDIATKIVQDVQHEEILLSRCGKWIRPDDAIILPANYIDDHGPIFSEVDINMFLDSPLSYINRGSRQFEHTLSVLNCRRFDQYDVEHIVTNPHFRFSERPQEWFMHDIPVRSYRFLKLQDGTFTFISETDPIYLPSPTVPVPDRVDSRVMDRTFYDSVITDANATSFLTDTLGLRVFTDSIAVEKIIDYHIRIARNRVVVPRQVLINHAQYLVRRQQILDNLSFLRRSALIASFQFVDAKNSRCSRSQITRNSLVNWHKGAYALSDIPSQNVRFLHRDYQSLGLENFVWEFFGLRRYPPLLNSGNRLAEFYRKDMSPRNLGDNRILYLLTTNEMFSQISNGPREIRGELGELEVFCQDKSLIKLNCCALPSTELKSFMNGLGPMSWLDVSQPHHQKWKSLKDFGLTITPDFRLYIEKLRRIKETSLQTALLRQEIRKIYTELEKLCENDDNLVHQLQTSFDQDDLLLIELDQTQTIWTSPKSVVSSTPSFCRFIQSYPGKTTKSFLLDSFGQLLGVERWSAESHLHSELRHFVYAFQGNEFEDEDDWKATCKYLFHAIRSIPQTYYHGNVSSCASWICEILRLSIFPVRSPGRTLTLQGLQNGSIFVPNSPALNSELGDKVNLLKFVGQDIYQLVPFLEFVQRYVSSSVKFLSAYDNEAGMNIQGAARVCIDAEERLALRKKYIARLLYSSNTRNSDFTEFGDFQAKWNCLEVQEVHSITQWIFIPEMQLKHLRKRFFLLRSATNDKTVIYLAKDNQAIEFLSLYLGLALERYFHIPDLGSKLDKILSSPVHMISDLLSIHWGIRELPPEWVRQLEEEGVQDPVSQDAGDAAVSSMKSSQLISQAEQLSQYQATSSPETSRGICSTNFRTTTIANTGNAPGIPRPNGQAPTSPSPNIPRPNFEHHDGSESDWSDDQNITPSRPTSEIIREHIGALRAEFDRMTDEQRRQRRRTGPSVPFSRVVREAAVSSEPENPPATAFNAVVSRNSLYRPRPVDQGLQYGRQGVGPEDNEDGEEVEEHTLEFESRSRRLSTFIHNSTGINDELQANSSRSSQDEVLHLSNNRIRNASPYHAPTTQFPPNRADQTQRGQKNVISGTLGECFIFYYLQEELPDFDERNWTSCNRAYANLEHPGREGRADFEYLDREGKFGTFLRLSYDTTGMNFLIEVKSTTASGGSRFHLSRNQLELAQRCHRSEREILVIFRVEEALEVRDSRITHEFVDPIQCIANGQLHISVPKEVTVDVDIL